MHQPANRAVGPGRLVQGWLAGSVVLTMPSCVAALWRVTAIINGSLEVSDDPGCPVSTCDSDGWVQAGL
jgi:hypothetical protein